ncbi:polysaccharide deacetylase family protein [Chloroflexus sp.]|uniref:polysaccharide deacetylase family protein n=1 Tax=Chloroflexus sp. TaxID=1904827 RepID=UPI002ACEF62B|nr:polysaccharide deacetylase family protein [Chloroflexus sp.]
MAHPRSIQPSLSRTFRRWLAPAGRRLLGTLVRVATTEPVVALTFDDGPHPLYTPHLLDLLERYHARATFFLLGQHAVGQRDLVARMATTGHAIGNHTFTHIRMPQTPRWQRWRELWLARRALAPFASALFRPPYGGQSYGSRVDALLFGYEVVGWSYHIEDWVAQPPDRLAERLLAQMQPGSIVLLHDRLVNPRDPAAVARTPLLTALAQVLAQVGTRYRFVTVPELIRAGTPVRVPWFRPAL